MIHSTKRHTHRMSIKSSTHKADLWSRAPERWSSPLAPPAPSSPRRDDQSAPAAPPALGSPRLPSPGLCKTAPATTHHKRLSTQRCSKAAASLSGSSAKSSTPGGFPTWLSSSILRFRLSISMFCWLFLSCSSEMVCFCWLPWSCNSCSDERSEWSFSSSADTRSCCSEEVEAAVRMLVRKDIAIHVKSENDTQGGGKGELVQCGIYKKKTLCQVKEFVCERTSSCRIWVLTLCSSCSAMTRSVTHRALALLSSYKRSTWCHDTKKQILNILYTSIYVIEKLLHLQR